ncbi:MAG: TolC family protein [Burkholderiaceae bacterium]
MAAARAAMLPRIDLSASGSIQTVLASGASAGTASLYSLIAGLTYPIFDHGALAGQRDYTVARREELVTRYRSAVMAALGDVQKAWTVLDHLARQEAAQARVVEQSRRAFALDQLQYRAGTEDLLSVLDTQRTLYAAQDQIAQIKLARLQALVGLYKALGGGWSQANPS